MKVKISKSMQAAVIHGFGDPDVLELATVPTPELDPGGVLIAIHTAGVGPWDADIRGGWWPEGRPRFPVILGTDGSGTAVAVGSRVRRFKVGDKVYAYSWANSKGGFYAQYVAVAAEKTARIPKTLDLRKAGAIATTGLTALQGVDDALKIKRGESVIVHGATGGVGSLALQFAKLRGARVLGTGTGSDGKAFVRRLGADVAVDGKNEDIAASVQKFAPKGVDAVLAFAGGDALEKCIDALRRGGRVAYPNGVEPGPKKRSGVKITSYDGTPGVRQFEKLNRAVDAARVKVAIAAAYPLAEAAKAHERLAEGHVLGKIVLKVR